MAVENAHGRPTDFHRLGDISCMLVHGRKVWVIPSDMRIPGTEGLTYGLVEHGEYFHFQVDYLEIDPCDSDVLELLQNVYVRYDDVRHVFKHEIGQTWRIEPRVHAAILSVLITSRSFCQCAMALAALFNAIPESSVSYIGPAGTVHRGG